MADPQTNWRVLVTGGSSGIGASIGERLASSGSQVALVARDALRLQSVALQISKLGTHVQTYPADVQDKERLDDIVRDFRPTGVVCSAGVLGLGDALRTLTFDSFLSTLAINVGGTFNACQAAIQYWQEAGATGDIVTVASLSGIRGLQIFPGMSAYAASKHAVVGLTEALALEMRAEGIRINGIAPGLVATPMAEELGARARTQPAELYGLVEFLLDRSRSGPISGSIVEAYCNE